MRIRGHAKSANSQLLLIVLLASIAVLPAHAQSYDECDNKIEFEKGEQAGKFLWLEIYPLAYALAEKFCGAPATGMMSSKFLGAVER